MKQIFKKIIVWIITCEAKLVLFRFKPKIIAVAGSVGKTSTKDAIYTALSDSLKIRKNEKSFNSDIGTPITILGLENGWNDPIIWLKNIFLGLVVVFKKDYPEWLVLEVGADRPGDIKSTAKWIKPNVVVITALPKIPVHVEYFSSPQAVIDEDLSLIDYLKEDGTLVLNADEDVAQKAKEKFSGNIYTYGSDETATVSYSNKNIVYEEKEGVKLPSGMSFKVMNSGNSVPITLNKVLGVQHILPVVAAIAVGLSQKLPFLDIVSAFAKFDPPKGRMNIIEGKNNSLIIDDTYNASPVAVQKAIEVLEEIKTDGKKIAVLGDMLEIGQYSASEHKKVGQQIYEAKIDVLISVGPRAKIISETATASGMKEKNIFHFKTYEGVSDLVLNNLKNGDVVLVKGSQSIRLEKVVSELISENLDKTNLLVRQDDNWQNK